MKAAGTAGGKLWAKSELNGPLPELPGVMATTRVGVAAQALQGSDPREVHCALGMLLVSSNLDCRGGSNCIH